VCAISISLLPSSQYKTSNYSLSELSATTQHCVEKEQRLAAVAEADLDELPDKWTETAQTRIEVVT
jgi:hypothetical protein